jgi:hypothetical protein
MSSPVTSTKLAFIDMHTRFWVILAFKTCKVAINLVIHCLKFLLLAVQLQVDLQVV